MYGIVDAAGNLVSLATNTDSDTELSKRGQYRVVLPDNIDWRAQKWDKSTRALITNNDAVVSPYTMQDLHADILLIKAKIGL